MISTEEANNESLIMNEALMVCDNNKKFEIQKIF